MAEDLEFGRSGEHLRSGRMGQFHGRCDGEVIYMGGRVSRSERYNQTTQKIHLQSTSLWTSSQSHILAPSSRPALHQILVGDNRSNKSCLFEVCYWFVTMKLRVHAKIIMKAVIWIARLGRCICRLRICFPSLHRT